MYFWDTGMWANTWAMLEPAGMKQLLGKWLTLDLHGDVYALDCLSGLGGEKWYAANDWSVFRCLEAYLDATGESGFLAGENQRQDGAQAHGATGHRLSRVHQCQVAPVPLVARGTSGGDQAPSALHAQRARRLREEHPPARMRAELHPPRPFAQRRECLYAPSGCQTASTRPMPNPAPTELRAKAAALLPAVLRCTSLGRGLECLPSRWPTGCNSATASIIS